MGETGNEMSEIRGYMFGENGESGDRFPTKVNVLSIEAMSVILTQGEGVFTA